MLICCSCFSVSISFCNARTAFARKTLESTCTVRVNVSMDR